MKLRGFFLFSLASGCCLWAISIGIVTDSHFFGEREVAWRIKKSAESLGWEVHLDEERGLQVLDMEGLDWTLCLIPGIQKVNPNCSNYMTFFHSFKFFDEEGKMDPQYLQYDGYAITIPPAVLSATAKEQGRDLFWTRFYPTLPSVPYAPLSFKEIVTLMPVWGDRLNEEKYSELYSLLSESGLVKFYGRKTRGSAIRKGYMGKLPFDGTSIIDAFQKHGIALVLHSCHHLANGLPSPRIFEAAAASTVIISDQNQFVKDHFQDSVFYVDTDLPPKEIFSQIASHVAFIKAHPAEALAKALRSHQIFEDKFLMTDQLLQLQALHEQIRHLKN